MNVALSGLVDMVMCGQGLDSLILEVVSSLLDWFYLHELSIQNHLCNCWKLMLKWRQTRTEIRTEMEQRFFEILANCRPHSTL